MPWCETNNMNSAAKSHLSLYTHAHTYIYGSVMHRNVIMLYWNPEPLVCKSMWFYVHSENVYLMFDDAINLKKGKRQTFQLKDMYKMSRAV